MSVEYEIYHGDKPVGKAEIEKCGMYYCISCRCHTQSTQMHRIKIRVEEREIPLGICVPLDKNHVGLKTRLLCKLMEGNHLRFYIEFGEKKGRLISVSETEPFSALSRVMQTRFRSVEGRYYLELIKQTERFPQGNDPSQEYDCRS